MNLKSKGARRTLAATCSTAVVLAGASFFASPAQAATGTLSVSGSTSVNVLTNTDTTSNTLDAATYGTRVTTPVTAPVRVKLLSSPAAGSVLKVAGAAIGASATNGSTWTSLAMNASTATSAVDYTTGNVFFAPAAAGTYTLELFEDADGNGDVSSGDNLSPVITLNVKSPGQASAATVWAPYISVPTVSLAPKVRVPAKVDLSALTTDDVRGAGVLGTKISNLIYVSFDNWTTSATASYGGGNAYALSAPPAAGATTTAYVAYDTSGDGSVAAGEKATHTQAASTLAAASTPITSLTELSNTDVTGSILGTAGSNSAEHTTAIKGGTAAVTYSTSAQAASTASQPVFFTLTPTAGTTTPTRTCSSTPPSLSADGTLVFSYGNGIKLYSANTATSSDRTASLVVTSSDTTADCPSYTVAAEQNGRLASHSQYTTVFTTDGTAGHTFTIAAGDAANVTAALPGNESAANVDTAVEALTGVGAGTATVSKSGNTFTVTLTGAVNQRLLLTGAVAGYITNPGSDTTLKSLSASYQSPKPTSILYLNNDELMPAVGNTSVTLKAKLYDQFGTDVAPLSSDPQSATVTVTGLGSATTAPYTGGHFVATYAVPTPPTSPTTSAISWSYGPAYMGNASTSTITDTTGSLTWVSTAAANSVQINAPVDAATGVKLSTASTLAPGQTAGTYGNSTGEITGVVTDAAGATMPFKKVSISGTDGVYFSTSSTGAAALTKTASATTDANGNFSGVYAFFTKVETAKITVTVDGKSDTNTVTVLASTDPYIASNNDAFGTAGSAITLTGRVADMFGNPVANSAVHVSVNTPGTYSPTDQDVLTGTDGTYSLTFTPNAGTKGDFVVTSTAYTTPNATKATAVASGLQTANEARNATWTGTAGLTGLQAGQYTDTAKLTVGPIILSGPKSRSGEGMVRLIGVANPNSVVTIKGFPAGSTTGLVDYMTVTADAKGDFQAELYVTRTTSFVAVSGGQYSPTVTVAVTYGSSNTGGGIPDPKNFKAGVKALGSGKVALTAVGNGDTRSTVTVYVLSGKTYKKVATAKVDKKGVARVTVKTTKGTKTFKLVYTNGNKSASKIVKIRVK